MNRTLAALALVSLFATATVTAQQQPQVQYVVRTVVGVAGSGGYRDGIASQALFSRPTWVDVDRRSGAMLIVDRANQKVRRVLNGVVTTIELKTPFIANPQTVTFDFDGPFGGGLVAEPPTAGCGGGPYDRGFFVANTARNQIVFGASDPEFSNLAARDDASPLIGTGNAGRNDGIQTAAEFNNPTGVALSWGYQGRGFTTAADKLYIADTGNHVIRRIRYRQSFENCPQPYYVETMPGTFVTPRGIASAPDGSIYVADAGDHTIRRITADSRVELVAGEPGVPGSDGAHLNTPSGIDVNAEGEVFIADTGNGVIRKLTLDRKLVLVAGVPGVGGYLDGDANTALFRGPVGIRLLSESILIADTSNNVIRAIVTPVPPRRRRAGP